MAVTGRKPEKIGVQNFPFILESIFLVGKFLDVPQPGNRGFRQGIFSPIHAKKGINLPVLPRDAPGIAKRNLPDSR